MRLAALALIAMSGAVSAAPSKLLVAGGSWASFDRGQSCEAMAKPLIPVRKQEAEPYIAIAFDRGGPRQGQVFVRLRRPARPGSSVILTIGGQPFLLVARGPSAWSKDAAQETAILSAIRGAGGMRLESRSTTGRRMVDRFMLDGAPTAIDAAAAACSLPR